MENGILTQSSEISGADISRVNGCWQALVVSALVVCLLLACRRILEKRLSANVRCWLWRLTSLRLLLGVVLLMMPNIAIGLHVPQLAPSVTTTMAAPPAIPGLAEPLPAFIRTAPPESVTPSFAYFGSSRLGSDTVQSTPWRYWLNDWIGAPPFVRNTLPAFPLQALFGAGLCVCLIRLVLSLRRTRRLIRESEPISDPRIIELAIEISGRTGLRHIPRLARHSDLTSPLYAAGTILLQGGEQSDSELQLILAHEMAHARRRDLAYEIPGVMAQTLFFFDPFVLLARREERLARESAADALAVRVTGAAPATYARLLVTLAGSRRHALETGTVGAVEGGGLLFRRIEALRSGDVHARSSAGMIACGVAAATGAACLAPILLVPSPVSSKSIVRNWVPPDDPWRLMPVDALQVSGSKRIVGVARDITGKSLPRTPVGLRRLFFGDQLSRTVRVAFTSTDGTFVFNNLPTGEYLIDANPVPPPGADTKEFEAFRLRAYDYYGTTTPFYIPASRQSPVSVALTEFRWATVRGRLIDHATGRPIANVIVCGARTGSADLQQSQCMTDSNGGFAVKIDWVGPTTISAGTAEQLSNPAVYCRVAPVSLGCVVHAGETVTVPNLGGDRLPILHFAGPGGAPVLRLHVSLTPRDMPGSPDAQNLGVLPGTHSTQSNETDVSGSLLLARLKDGQFLAATPDGRIVAAGSFHLTPGGALDVTAGGVRRSFADGIGVIPVPESAVLTGFRNHEGANP